MEQYIGWIALGIAIAGALAALIAFIVKICKMTPEEREDMLIDFLLGLVTVAENTFIEQGMGAEKLQQVEQQFKQKAPWLYKILLSLTKTDDLKSLIEKALQRAKDTWGKKNSSNDTDKKE